MIALRSFPRASAEKVGIVEGGIVVAPVANVFDRARAGDGGLPLRALGDEPVGHVSAVAVPANAEAAAIGNAVFHQRVDAFENVLARAGDDLGNDLLQELVAIAR